VTPEKSLVVIFVCWVVSVLYGSVAYHVSVFDQSVGCQLSKVLNPHFVFFGCTTPVGLAIVVVAGEIFDIFCFKPCFGINVTV
jgi:hypothetical protein